MPETVLKVRNLKTHFHTFRGLVRAVDGISFDVYRGEALGLVGESGSGKTVTGLSILRLVPSPGTIVDGELLFRDTSLLALSEKDMRTIRGRKISMIFQNPRTALNPVLSVGEQIDRVYRTHTHCSARQARERRKEMLERVCIGQPKAFSMHYPHELSGGMCQRVMIVMALMCQPEIIIADEPTTGLDVTIQRQIIELLSEMRSSIVASQILVTHDLGLVAETCNRVVVMYASRIMEIATVQDLFASPAHPYTQGLIQSAPRLDKDVDPVVMPGYVPSAAKRPSGCPFHPRCLQAKDICREEEPAMKSIHADHTVACHLA